MVNGRCMILTIHVHLTPRLRMRGAIPLLFLYASMECTGTIPVSFSLYDRYVFFFSSFLVFMLLQTMVSGVFLSFCPFCTYNTLRLLKPQILYVLYRTHSLQQISVKDAPAQYPVVTKNTSLSHINKVIPVQRIYGKQSSIFYRQGSTVTQN